MNDIKYVMLPRIEDKPKQIKPQPWYKERIKEKYLTKNPNKEKLLDAKQWVFVKDGLDDFRDGLPPPHDDLLIKPTRKGPGPNIKNETWRFKESVLPVSTRLNKDQRCFSKKLPLAEARRQNIQQIIDGLQEHPLALYSHLEEALPPDLFEEILDILDPEINQQNLNESFNDNKPNSNESSRAGSKLEETQNHGGSRRNIREEMQKLDDKLKKEIAEKGNDSDKKNVRNTYKWLLRKEEAKAKAKGPDPEQIKAQNIDNHIKRVTEEYCEWVKSLGGEHNIDPITLTSLFASGYDTKPALSVPIHVVELTNIPAELRTSAYVPPDPNAQDDQTEKNIYRDTIKPSKAHPLKYGAWYLPKEHWKVMPSTEKLTDPKVIKDAEKEESKRRSNEINAKLAPLHGAQAFRDFVKNKKPQRVPKLLDELEQWETEQTIKSNAINAVKETNNPNLDNPNQAAATTETQQ